MDENEKIDLDALADQIEEVVTDVLQDTLPEVLIHMTFMEMQEMYNGIVRRFNKIELQDWKAEGAMIELSKQVGELAKQVMIKEKYYALTGEVTDVDERLGNEMADVIAQVMRLASYYDIDLEKAFIAAREDEDSYLKSRGV